MSEIWRDTPGYEGFYQVSDTGKIKSIPRTDRVGRSSPGRMMALAVNKRWGRLQVSLWKNGRGRTWKVHTLVALAFLGPQPKDMDVNHRDGNKLNNCASNLEYVTRKENIHHACAMGLIDKRGEKHHGAKLAEEDVIAIRAAHADGAKGVELAAQYGVAKSQISRIVNGTRWGNLAGNAAARPWRESFPVAQQQGLGI